MRTDRWRMIPSVFLVLFGGFHSLAGSIGLAILTTDSLLHNEAFRPMLALNAMFLAVSGCFWIVSGVLFWKRMWWVAGSCLILGLATGAVSTCF